MDTWEQIGWAAALAEVRQMQAEIVKAEDAGNERGVIYWQDRLVRTRAARLLAIRQVTSTNGRHAAGVDGVCWDSAAAKMQALKLFDDTNYTPQPARRVMIPKDDGRQRPLGILTMRDRAMQALYALALDPLAEMRADVHSYGFRKARGTTDAILACAEIFARKDGPQWVLEADIEACFDSISHDWLLRHIPLPKPILRDWLRAGYVEHGRTYPTRQGLPQGGIISPILANMALDGMEAMLLTYFQHDAASRARHQLAFVRYADDFIVAGADKRMLAREAMSLLANFLKARGMQFSARKTLITRITEGFDFLGGHVQADASWFGGYALRLTPSAKSLRKIRANVAETVAAHAEATPTALLAALNPVLRGWAGHYGYVTDRTALARLDADVSDLLRQWATRRQRFALRRRVLKTYFQRPKGLPPVFCDEAGQTVFLTQTAPRQPPTAIDPACRMYDPRWAAYLAQRE